MRTVPARGFRLRPGRWLGPRRFVLRLTGCAIFVGVAEFFTGGVAPGDLTWIANGIVLAYLLLVPRRRWPAYLGAALLGQIAGALALHTPWQHGVIVIPLNILEPFLAALLLRRPSAQFPRFTESKYVGRFIAFAGVLAPVFTGLAAAFALALWQHVSFLKYLAEWSVTDGLGACALTPACVAIFRTRLVPSMRSGWIWACLVVLAMGSIAVLSQSSAAMAFVLYPPLILVLLRFGRGWAAVATLVVGTIGLWYTLRGIGPFAAAVSLPRTEPAILLQLFVISALFMLYSVSDVIENLLATERQLTEIAAQHKLVTENSRDIIIVADFEGRRSFVSASGANWSGWSQEELLQFHSLELVHPADHPKVSQIIAELAAGKDDALVECRIRRHDESYVWVEASLRTIRNPHTGMPTGILNHVREITQRKEAEQQLAEAYRAVEALAITDALTGLANRRRFEQYLTTEWRRGLRERDPLSLVLIDADLFKSYNDTYGHLRGDNCLKQIAEAIQDVVSRPGDLVARFGGEEFAVVLPNTPASGAIQVAEEICAAMRNRQLPHVGNAAGIVTISAGCATLVPQLGHHSHSLVDCADRALYDAKRSGRNRVCAHLASAPNAASEALVALKSA